ncbi:plasma-membrane choline transporter-domain-containing protein [Cladochytrium replicatum]|nr:plasma-membrane choline transporter-domain-containing protein [Cladochytrium replicatum]
MSYYGDGKGYSQQQQQHYQPYALPQQPYYSQQPQGYAPPDPYSQPYAAPAYAPQHQQYYPPPPPDVQSSGAQKINKSPKFKDIWATILFLVHLAGIAFIFYLGLSTIIPILQKPPPTTSNSISFSAQEIGISIGIAVGVSGIFSILYYSLMQRFTGKMITFTFFLSILISLALAAFYIWQKVYVAGIIIGIFAILYALSYFAMRSRIPFAKVMLKTVCAITNKYPATLLTGLLGLLVSAAFNAAWILSLIGIVQRYQPRTESRGRVTVSYETYIIVVYMLFSLYWTTQVIYNTIHVTVCGLFATYYFLGTSAAGGEVTVPVSNPTLAAAKRALTTSFGSICFGSLIIAIIRTIRTLLRSAANQDAAEGNFCGAICAVCVECCLSWIESLIEYFNTYAYAQVAIYGKDFCAAAKDTWRLVKSHGIDAIINDSLISNVFSVGAFSCGFLSGVLGYVYINAANGANGIAGEAATARVIIVVVGAVLIGLAEFGLLSGVIDSGVTATFVCLAEDPVALSRTKPELYQKIVETYPAIQFGGMYS